MITVKEMCKQYLISNGWKSDNNYYTHDKLSDIIIHIGFLSIVHFQKDKDFVEVSHERGQSYNYLYKLHHTFDRITFGRGKLPYKGG